MPVHEPAPSGPRYGSAPDRGTIAHPCGPVTGRGRRVTAEESVRRLRSGTGGQRRSLLSGGGVDRSAVHSQHPADRYDVRRQETSRIAVSVPTAEPPYLGAQDKLLPRPALKRAACCGPDPEPTRRTRDEGDAMSVTSDAADPAATVHQGTAELTTPTSGRPGYGAAGRGCPD